MAKGVLYDSPIVDLLIATNALQERDACNDYAVGAAITTLLHATARGDRIAVLNLLISRP